jgi:anaerobic selenocysteine-containing dehydrogenase
MSSAAPMVVRGTCHHDCPDSCGWEATVVDGRAVRLRGNPDHPFSRGELCPKVNRFLERVYSPERVLHPLRRVGAKGEGRFERVSWDEALAEIARRLHGVIDRHGGEAVYGWNSAGNQGLLQMSSLDRRLFARMGASRLSGSLCGLTARSGVAATNGDGRGADPVDVRHARFVILWGTNTRITNRHLWPFVEEARADGATIVVIDPVRTATAEAADWFVQPLPGTDAALALAMMHVFVRDGLVDRDYVDAHAEGYDDLVERVAGWPPERAAEVCGLDAGEIERLARAYATTTPAMIRVLIGAEHRSNGAMLYRTIACLPVLTGAWRHRGGGLARSTSAWNGVAVDDGVFDAPHLAPPLPGGRERRAINMNELGAALTDPAMDPPVMALVVWGGNPLVTVPRSELIRAGLAREDLFCVVSEQFVTDTARYADLVLPATTQLEHLDVVPAWGHLNLGWNAPAIAPLGEAVPNTELWRRLAAAMGYTEAELFASDAELLDAALWRLDPGRRAELERDGFVRLPLPDAVLPFADGGFATASGRALLRNDGLAAIGQDPLPTHTPAPESPAGDPALAARYPLVLVTTKSHPRFLNSSYTHLPGHGSAEGGEPWLDIDAVDAAARGIGDGDLVEVVNDRAALVVRARIGDRLRPGVVGLPFGWWSQHHRDGGLVNALTNGAPTDWGGGVAFHDTLVEVRRHAANG